MSARKWAVIGLVMVIVSIALPLLLYNAQASSNAFFNQLAERTFVTGSWSPSGNYALLAGLGGCIYRFDGARFVDLTSGAPRGVDWDDVSWKPDGTAFITGITMAQGFQLVTLGFDGQGFTEEPSSGWSTGYPVSSVWAPNGSYALVLASNSYAKFYGNSFSRFTNTSSLYCRSASWKPDGSYALVTCVNYSQGSRSSGALCRYDGNNLSVIDKDLPMMLDCAWRPDGSYALAVGQNHTVAMFNGESVRVLTSGEPGSFISVAWKPDASYALVTGESSLVLKFDGKSFTRIPIATGAQYLWASWMPDGSSAIIYGLVPRYIHISSETGIENWGGGFVWRYDGDHLTQLTPLISAGPSLWPYLGAASVGAVIGLSVILVAARKRKPETKDSEPHDATPVASARAPVLGRLPGKPATREADP